MKNLWMHGAVALSLLSGELPKHPASQSHTAEHGVREDRKRAADGVTEGWVLTYDNPDPERSWERIAGRLVIARRGKVIRSWEILTVRNWLFWDGGREVAVEWGGLHFGTHCYLASVRTGRKVASYPGWCGDAGENAPAWVKALEGFE